MARATVLPIRAKSAIELIPDIDSMLLEAKRIERNLGTLERESAFSSASGAKRSDNGPDALRILGNQPEIAILFTDVRCPDSPELNSRKSRARRGQI